MKGIVTDIQRFSVHDGPGIRTTVVLKGCNLRCGWCHNPETLRPGPELQFMPSRCIGCGACFKACPRDAHVAVDGQHIIRRELCEACGTCTKTCYAQALVLIGREMEAGEVLAEVLDDREFYETSGGGVTLSGGEPLFQPDFAGEILGRCKAEGLHTAIQTNLSMPWEHVAGILPLTDLVMLDIKMMDGSLHETHTGMSNRHILENATRLSHESNPVVVRTPIIPGINDSPDEVAAIARFIAGFPNLAYYELLPYHPLGKDKYRSLGLECRVDGVKPPTHEKMLALAEAALGNGMRVWVGGQEVKSVK